MGRVVAALQRAGLWRDTVMLFTTDNGASPNHGGSNWPLRGVKHSLWEGGVRGAAFLAGGRVPPVPPARQLLHITDWFPSLLTAAGHPRPPSRDGVDQWAGLVGSSPRHAPRTTAVLGLRMHDAVEGAVRVGNYKLLFATRLRGDRAGWYRPGPAPHTRPANYSQLVRVTGDRVYLAHPPEQKEDGTSHHHATHHSHKHEACSP